MHFKTFVQRVLNKRLQHNEFFITVVYIELCDYLQVKSTNPTDCYNIFISLSNAKQM